MVVCGKTANSEQSMRNHLILDHLYDGSGQTFVLGTPFVSVNDNFPFAWGSIVIFLHAHEFRSLIFSTTLTGRFLLKHGYI